MFSALDFPIFHSAFLERPIWVWTGFLDIVVILLVLDLCLLHSREREIGIRESLLLSSGYILISLLFGAGIYFLIDTQSAKDFFTAYLVEKSLSMDNLFVMTLVFAHFYIPRRYQHRVLFYGVLGAVVLRGIMIGLGVALLSKYHWILYIFSAFLLFTGIKILWEKEEEEDLKQNSLLLWLKRRIRVTQTLHENRFFAHEAEPSPPHKLVYMATPLLLALVFIEISDIVFAVDSVPAVFAVTTDPFIVYTSNILAILGLRALYFALAAILHRFAYVKYSISCVLIFIGGKALAPLAGIHVPSEISLAVTLFLLGIGVLLSLYKTKGEKS